MDTSDERSQETPSSYWRQIRPALVALPKIDLHRHLEGSLRLSTLAEIAHQHGVDLPSWSLEELRPYVQMVGEPPDFQTFLSKFRLLRRECGSAFCLVTPGIRPADAAADDQSRIMTPRAALEAGSSYLVIGRPITRAPDPLLALREISQQIGGMA